MEVVAQCDLEQRSEMLAAIDCLELTMMIASFPIFIDNPDILEAALASSITLVGITYSNLQVPEEVANKVHGTICRNITAHDLVACVRSVSRGRRYVQVCQEYGAETLQNQAGIDNVGVRVRNLLTPRETQVLGLIARAYKIKQIAECIGITDQVVKNYTRHLFEKCGVTDRLALAVFIGLHPCLAEAGEKASAILIEQRRAHHLLQFPAKKRRGKQQEGSLPKVAFA